MRNLISALLISMLLGAPLCRAEESSDEDGAGSPSTDYGAFNEDEDEAADTRFYQFGRFFGVSLGLNYEGATGNRGKLWQGGFPGVDFRLHYWFDFNFALDLGVYSTPHEFEAAALGGVNSARVLWTGINFKYYIDTKNLSSAITFMSPYVLCGFGTYLKTQTPTQIEAGTDKDSAFGLGPGVGMELTISPKKSYFFFEGKYHFVNFKDSSYTELASQGIPNLKGGLYTLTGGLLFTW